MANTIILHIVSPSKSDLKNIELLKKYQAENYTWYSANNQNERFQEIYKQARNKIINYEEFDNCLAKEFSKYVEILKNLKKYEVIYNELNKRLIEKSKKELRLGKEVYNVEYYSIENKDDITYLMQELNGYRLISAELINKLQLITKKKVFKDYQDDAVLLINFLKKHLNKYFTI